MVSNQRNRIAVLLHLFNTNHLNDFALTLEHLNEPFDLLVNLVEDPASPAKTARQQDQILALFPKADIVLSQNRGMDIGGMFRLFDLALGRGYTAMLYVHSKSDSRWRRSMLIPLITHSQYAIDLLGTKPSATNPRQFGMVGSYFYAFDYYNISPFLQIMEQLGITLRTSWEPYFSRFPAARILSLGQRIAHARDTCNQDLDKIKLRPEIDLEYVNQMFGDIHSNRQIVNSRSISRMIEERVIAQLPFYPGNFFWISGKVVRKLSERINFQQEYDSLPLNLSSDQVYQSRAHAWERALPVFSMKSGLLLDSLQTKGRDSGIMQMSHLNKLTASASSN